MDVCQAGFSGIIQNVCEILFNERAREYKELSVGLRAEHK